MASSPREGGGGELPYGTDGDARRKFGIQPLKETIWAWLKVLVTPKGYQSGRGLKQILTPNAVKKKTS